MVGDLEASLQHEQRERQRTVMVNKMLAELFLTYSSLFR